MKDLLRAYNKSHSLDDPFNTNKRYEELIAQISGHHANDPEFAREMFSPLINDHDGFIAAIENAHNTFAEQTTKHTGTREIGCFFYAQNEEVILHVWALPMQAVFLARAPVL